MNAPNCEGTSKCGSRHCDGGAGARQAQGQKQHQGAEEAAEPGPEAGPVGHVGGAFVQGGGQQLGVDFDAAHGAALGGGHGVACAHGGGANEGPGALQQLGGHTASQHVRGGQ